MFNSSEMAKKTQQHFDWKVKRSERERNSYVITTTIISSQEQTLEYNELFYLRRKLEMKFTVWLEEIDWQIKELTKFPCSFEKKIGILSSIQNFRILFAM